PLEHFREGLVWYWPEKAQNQQRPPLRLRRIRVRGKKKQAVWLLTNVLQPERRGRRRAAELYRSRGQVEGVVRAYKRTLPEVRRKWPRRKDHKAPKPPKLRVLSKRLKARINKYFRAK